MRWLEIPVVHRYRPEAGGRYLPGRTFRIGHRRVQRELYEVVGRLGRYLVYSAITERRYAEQTLMARIQMRLGTYRRLPLPE